MLHHSIHIPQRTNELAVHYEEMSDEIISNDIQKKIYVTSSSGSVQGPPKDGFAHANSHRMGRKMASMKITGKATGCRVRAASPLSNDVFAKKFHKDTTEKELSDYLIANNIIPKSVHVISHVQARTKSYKICCDRENFVKCFNENLWPNSIEIRKYNPLVGSGRL